MFILRTGSDGTPLKWCTILLQKENNCILSYENMKFSNMSKQMTEVSVFSVNKRKYEVQKKENQMAEGNYLWNTLFIYGSHYKKKI